MTGIFLLLGSNLGDRHDLLSQAIAGIESRIGEIDQRSSLYNTASWGIPEIPDFLNQVLKVNTSLNPYALLYQCISIEIALGRQSRIMNGSRYMDIDILYYGNQVIKSPILSIPHQKISLRRFVLEPMVEIAPHEVHPVLGLSQQELLEKCSDPLSVKQLRL